jgi:hypothetical protein
MYQIIFEAMTIENIAAPAFQIDAARLAGFPFVRWKFFAGISQRISWVCRASAIKIFL